MSITTKDKRLQKLEINGLIQRRREVQRNSITAWKREAFIIFKSDSNTQSKVR